MNQLKVPFGIFVLRAAHLSFSCLFLKVVLQMAHANMITLACSHQVATQDLRPWFEIVSIFSSIIFDRPLQKKNNVNHHTKGISSAAQGDLGPLRSHRTPPRYSFMRAPAPIVHPTLPMPDHRPEDLRRPCLRQSLHFRNFLPPKTLL